MHTTAARRGSSRPVQASPGSVALLPSARTGAFTACIGPRTVSLLIAIFRWAGGSLLNAGPDPRQSGCRSSRTASCRRLPRSASSTLAPATRECPPHPAPAPAASATPSPYGPTPSSNRPAAAARPLPNLHEPAQQVPYSLTRDHSLHLAGVCFQRDLSALPGPELLIKLPCTL